MSTANLLKQHIDALQPGAVFCARDFYGLSSRGNVDVVLHRLAQSGFIRRLGFGLYDKPKKSSLLGYLNPDIALVVKAYQRRTGQKLILDPLGAANSLQLTPQVPSQLTFLTDGKSHTMQICDIKIKLIHASPKMLAGSDTTIGIIIQALRYFGTNLLPQKALDTLRKQLSDDDLLLLRSLRTKTLRHIAAHIDRILQYASLH